MIKYILTSLWVLVCAVVLLIGHSHWAHKIVAHSNDTETVLAADTEEKTVDVDTLLAKAKNWPSTAQEQLKNSLKDKKRFKIVFVGTKEMDGWDGSLSAKLADAYGKENIDFTALTYDTTTKEFVTKDNQLEIASLKPQLVVFEPFLLNDNGKVEINDTLANLTKIIGDVKAADPGVTFILQPSYPIYNPKIYQLQVNALKEFSVKNKLVYLDHWGAWPNIHDVKIKEYVTTDQTGPTEKGNQVWLKYLSDYFIASK